MAMNAKQAAELIRNGNEWTRDNEADENGERPAGLKGKFKNGTEVHYADKDLSLIHI